VKGEPEVDYEAKEKQKRIRPYKPIKREYVEMSDPFGNLPVEARRTILG